MSSRSRLSASSLSRQLRRRLLVWATWAAVVGLTACDSDAPAAESSAPAATGEADLVKKGCDKDKVIALGNTAATMGAGPMSTSVWAGLRGACGDALPVEAQLHYGDSKDKGPDVEARLKSEADEVNARMAAVCPNSSEVIAALQKGDDRAAGSALFGGCKLDRYDVLTKAEAAGGTAPTLVWVMHQWLLDQGFEPGQAKPITRALFAYERHLSSLARPLEGVKVPEAVGWPLEPGFALHLTKTQMQLDDEKVVALADGYLRGAHSDAHIIPKLSEAIARGWAKTSSAQGPVQARMNIAADAATPFETVLDAMYTAGRAKVSSFVLVVSPSDGLDFLGLQVRSPKPDSEDPSGVLTLELKPGSYTVLARPNVEGRSDSPYPGRAGDYGDLIKIAKAAKAQDKTATRVVVSAVGDTPLSEVVAALVAVRGEGCGEVAGACLFPEVLVQAKDAHSFRDAAARAAEDEDIWGSLTGSEVAEAYGIGGLGLVGTGYGSGGTGEGTIGLGNTGLIGKGTGKGKGAGYGRGSGSGFGGNGKRVPKVQQGTVVAVGDLDKDIIRRIIRAHVNEVRGCYSAGLTKNPELEGKVTIEFVIAGSGKVGSAVVQQTDLVDPATSQCVAKAVKSWKFPKPRDGNSVKALAPFMLSPS